MKKRVFYCISAPLSATQLRQQLVLQFGTTRKEEFGIGKQITSWIKKDLRPYLWKAFLLHGPKSQAQNVVFRKSSVRLHSVNQPL